MGGRRYVVRALVGCAVVALLGGCSASASPSAAPTVRPMRHRGCWTAQTHLYWALNAPNGTSLGVANLDGTGVNKNFITAPTSPCGVADRRRLHLLGEHRPIPPSARRSGGPTSTGPASTRASSPAPRLPAGWPPTGRTCTGPTPSQGDGTSIGRANLDGTGVNQSFISGAQGPCGVALEGTHVYWANEGYSAKGTTIGRANLDGTGVNQSFIGGARPRAASRSTVRTSTGRTRGRPATGIRLGHDDRTSQPRRHGGEPELHRRRAGPVWRRGRRHAPLLGQRDSVQRPRHDDRAGEPRRHGSEPAVHHGRAGSLRACRRSLTGPRIGVTACSSRP